MSPGLKCSRILPPTSGAMVATAGSLCSVEMLAEHLPLGGPRVVGLLTRCLMSRVRVLRVACRSCRASYDLA